MPIARVSRVGFRLRGTRVPIDPRYIARRRILLWAGSNALGCGDPDMNAPKGTGCLEDYPDARDGAFSVSQILKSGPLPAKFDLSGYVREMYDQGTTNSCVLWALLRALHIRAQIEGLDVPFGSVRAGYSLARAYDTTDPKTPLEDTGSRPRSAVQILRTWGVCSETKCPWDPAKINERPDWSALRSGVSYKPSKFWWVLEDGWDRVERIQRCLAANYPVCISVPTSMIDPTATGNHYVCIVGYDSNAFRYVNSWGGTFGDRGFGWLYADQIVDPNVRSILAVGVEGV